MPTTSVVSKINPPWTYFGCVTVDSLPDDLPIKYGTFQGNYYILARAGAPSGLPLPTFNGPSGGNEYVLLGSTFGRVPGSDEVSVYRDNTLTYGGKDKGKITFSPAQSKGCPM